MEVVFLAKKDCEKVDDGNDKGSTVTGFNLSNGALSLSFDSNNHLSSWSTLSNSQSRSNQETHPLYQTYLSYNELITSTSSATDGANVYTFDPMTTSQEPTTLTPKVLKFKSSYIKFSL